GPGLAARFVNARHGLCRWQEAAHTAQHFGLRQNRVGRIGLQVILFEHAHLDILSTSLSTVGWAACLHFNQALNKKRVPAPPSSARRYTATAAATSCSAVPVESKTKISSALVRPGLRPATILPSSAYTPAGDITPAVMA